MNLIRKKRRNYKAGATILEVLVVLAIIVLLASIVAPRVIRYLGSAKSDAGQLQITNLATAVQMFYIDTGRYPSEAEGLGALMTSPTGAAGWNGPYMDSANALTDPWTRDYIYAVPGTGSAAFSITSLGRDGSQGGEGEDVDLNN